jgi:hypothetical protein
MSATFALVSFRSYANPACPKPPDYGNQYHRGAGATPPHSRRDAFRDAAR